MNTMGRVLVALGVVLALMGSARMAQAGDGGAGASIAAIRAAHDGNLREASLDLYFERCGEVRSPEAEERARTEFEGLDALRRPDFDADDLHEAAERLGRRGPCEGQSLRVALLTSERLDLERQKTVLLTIGSVLLGGGGAAVAGGLIATQVGYGLDGITGGIVAMSLGVAAAGWGTGLFISAGVKEGQRRAVAAELGVAQRGSAAGLRVSVAPGGASLTLRW